MYSLGKNGTEHEIHVISLNLEASPSLSSPFFLLLFGSSFISILLIIGGFIIICELNREKISVQRRIVVYTDNSIEAKVEENNIEDLNIVTKILDDSLSIQPSGYSPSILSFRQERKTSHHPGESRYFTQRTKQEELKEEERRRVEETDSDSIAL